MESKEISKATLSDKELINKCREWIDRIFEIEDVAKFLSIPSDYENDPDVLFMELIRRYKDLGEIVCELEGMMTGKKRLPEDNKVDLSKFMGKGSGMGAAMPRTHG